MRNKIWEYRSEKLKKDEIIAFANSIKMPPAIAAVLMNRGVCTEKDAAAYFKKSLEGVHNPFLLNDMENAADRIISALEAKEKITVYGDYDADGITSTALLYSFLRKAGADADYYVPDRTKEGYGVNIIAVNKIARSGTKLMITVDCGITSLGEVEFAKTQGMDVIITDHHTCPEELPRAAAVINPKRQDSEYPFSGLAGAGVAFKLVLALAIRLGINTKETFFEYADLAAIGTIADVVPLIDENRIIADKGLAAIRNTKNVGLRALLNVSGLDAGSVDSTAAAFMLAPRINAAGRMESARTAIELLLEEDETRALEIASFLNDANQKRRIVEQQIYEEALAQAESFSDEQYIYVLNHSGWHNGVIGIAASKICEKFYRPCILISCADGKGKGSARSIEEINLYDAISECDDLLTAFGGHSQAAGLSINENKIDEFRRKINAYVKTVLGGRRPVPKLYIDCRLDPANVTIESAKMLRALEPFGQENEAPVFSMHGLTVVALGRMGADGRHLRLRLARSNYVFTAVGFGMGDFADVIFDGDTVNAAFTLNVNVYQGRENLQLMLKDIKK